MRTLSPGWFQETINYPREEYDDSGKKNDEIYRREELKKKPELMIEDNLATDKEIELQEITGHIKSPTGKKYDTVADVSKKKSPKLIILATTHQSVEMEINGVRLGLKQSFNNVTFEESKNEIVRTKNL